MNELVDGFVVYLLSLVVCLWCTECTRETVDVVGFDVSHHQGMIDWKKVRANVDGDVFVYVKCTEGADYTDSAYKYNMWEAKKNGFLVGGYHFFRMTSGAVEQFINFKRALGSVHQDVIPMIDVETNDGKPVSELQDSLRVFLKLVEKAYGRKPMIYGTMRSYNTYCAPEFNNYPLYIGRYGDNAPIVNGKGHYTVWQYTEEGSIPGIPKPVDLCRFHQNSFLCDILF